jgi:hypothetical protein
MSEITQEQALAAAKNEWDKVFTLGPDKQRFEIKDLPYFDYLEFVTLVKPIIAIGANTIDFKGEGGELDIVFDPTTLDFDKVIAVAGKDLPKLGRLILKQTNPKITAEEAALLAHRPQRLIEIIIMQILHNNMIQEFGAFFTRLKAMVTVMLPDLANAVAPTGPETTTEETLSSSLTA